MFSGLDPIFDTFIVLFLLFVPLGIWKAAEIVCWLFAHVRFI